MLDSFDRGFRLEMLKEAFASGFVAEMQKVAILPLLLGLGAGALMGGATMGIAAATKPADLTWRGAGFTPGKMMGHMFDYATSAIGGPKGALVSAGLSAMSGGKNSMSFRPPSISGSPMSQLTKKVPGAF